MSNLGWSIRPATIGDSATLADIVIEATKAQGRWTRSSAEEDAWRKEYAEWGAEQVKQADPSKTLSVIEEHGPPLDGSGSFATTSPTSKTGRRSVG